MSCIITDINEARLVHSYNAIGSAIVDYINNMDLVWEVEIARRIYFGPKTDFYNESDHQSYKPFIQWLIFSYKLHNGKSLLESICEKYTVSMNKSEVETLYSMRKTQEGLYKVYSINLDDNSILVKNIFTNDMAWVSDSVLAKNVKRYYGIFMRTVSINGRLVPIPGFSVMSNSFLKETRGYILEKFRQQMKYENGMSLDKFINCNSLMIHRHFLDFNFQ